MKKNNTILYICFAICVLSYIGFIVAVFEKDKFSPLTLSIIYCVCSVLFIISYFILYGRIIQRRKIKKTFSTITETIKNGNIIDSADLRRIYEVNGMEAFFGTFASFLDCYLVSLLEKQDDRVQYESKKDDQEGKVKYDFINRLLRDIIKTEREKKPYDGVNEREQKLLLDIESAAENDRFSEVKSGLSYLANVLIENQQIYSKQNQRNNFLTRLGVIVTIAGLIATIIVFIIQQRHSITSSGIKQNVKEVIESCNVVDTNGVVNYHLQSAIIYEKMQESPNELND